MFGSSATIVVGRVLGSVAGLVLVGWLSRALPRDELGHYAVAMTLATIGAVIGQLGQRVYLTRQLPLVDRPGPVIRRSVLAVLGASTLLGTLWLLAGGPRDGWGWTALGAGLLLMMALQRTLVGALTGTGRVVWGGLALQAFYPGFGLAAVGAMAIAMGVLDATVALRGQFLGSLGVVGLTALGLFVTTPAPPPATTVRPSVPWVQATLPLTLLGGLGILSSQVDLLLVRALDSPDGAGLYFNAAALSFVPGYALHAANMVIMPAVSRAWAERQPDEMHRLLGQSLQFAVVGAVPATLGVIVAYPLGTQFGVTFAEGMPILAVLLAGQAVNVLCGSVGVTLLMSGHERLVAASFAATLTVNVLLSAVLVPILGPLGAAVGTAVALAVWNVWLVVNVRARVGVDTSVARVLATGPGPTRLS